MLKMNGNKSDFRPQLGVVLGMAIGVFCLSCGPELSEKRDLGENQKKDSIAISAVSKARAEAFRQGNAAGIALHFTENSMLMAPDKEVQRGRDAVEAYYQHLFDTWKTDLKSEYLEVKVSGNIAYGRGFAEVTLIPKSGGDTLKSTAKYLNILERQPDGSWKTTHDIWNANEPSGK